MEDARKPVMLCPVIMNGNAVPNMHANQTHDISTERPTLDPMSITAANCPSPADASLRGPGGPDGFSAMGGGWERARPPRLT
jgi:hypothetical protein